MKPPSAMRNPSPAHAGPHRGRPRPAELVLGALALLLAAVACKDSATNGGTLRLSAHPEEIVVGGRRDLVLEASRVELIEGFEQRTRIRTYVNYSQVNLDRPEVAVPLWRDSAIVWKLDAATGSRFSTRVARLHPHSGGDAMPCLLKVTALRADGSVDGPSASIRVPGYPADHSDVVGFWREGPSALLELMLPQGAASLRIEVISRNGAPERGAVALLSPQLHEPRRRSRWADAPLRFANVQRLLGRIAPCVGDDRVVFALQRDGDGTETDIEVCPREAVANFTGHEARPALALLQGVAADFDIDVAPDSVFRTAAALDERVPPDTRGRLTVSIDGIPVGTQDFGHLWRELALPLGDYVGRGRRLTLSVSTLHFTPAWNTRPVVDPASYRKIDLDFHASLLRAGLADPRIESPAEVVRRAASTQRPAVIVLHIETLRADFLPLWGGSIEGLTPNLDRLARRSVVFDTAIAPSSWTLPSTVTLLTGLLPSAHGVVRKARSLVPPEVATLAERARDAGVVTAALVSNNLLSAGSGYERGFTTFAELHHANADQLLTAAEGFLGAHAGQQVLLWLHLMDPHFPYMAPGDWRDRYVEPDLAAHDADGAVDRIVETLREGHPVPADDPDVRVSVQRYLGEIAYLDHRIGALLDELERLGLDDQTALIVTADHGEEFLDHGIIGHGPELFDETVRVPLIVYDPAGRLGPPGRIDGVVSTAGLFATVLELLDVPYERDAVRPPLVPARAEQFAFTETNQGIARDGDHELLSRFVTAVRTPGELLVWRHALDPDGALEEQLFDLTADPRALHPLAAQGEAYERLRAMMEDSLAWSRSRRAASPVTGVDVEWLEDLRRIGYVDHADDDDQGG